MRNSCEKEECSVRLILTGTASQGLQAIEKTNNAAISMVKF